MFVVPLQILWYGDPARRSCEACESFGAMCKKVIKHLTCRRNVSDGTHHQKSGKSWLQAFKKGWVQQTFERICVRESLLHGIENSRYLSREDHALLAQGKSSKNIVVQRQRQPRAIQEMVEAPTVPTELMERAYMA